MPIPTIKTQKQALTLMVKVMSVKSTGMNMPYNNKKGDDEMNPSEQATVNVARSVLSQDEVETLAGLIHLRHNASAHVRIAANVALIPLLAKIKEGMLND